MFNTKKLSFTLAELLIALTIIGVIATMTVPRVMTGAKVKSDVVKLKNAYTGIKEAVRIAPTIAGYDIMGVRALKNTDPANYPRNIEAMLIPVFKATVRSGANYVYTASGKTIEWSSVPGVDAVVLSDYSDEVNIATANDLIYVGKNGVFYIIKERDFNAGGYSGKPLTLYIDINGISGPNEIVTCTTGTDATGTIPDSSAGHYVEPAPCTVDDGGVTDIYPFFIFESDVAPALNSVVAVLEK